MVPFTIYWRLDVKIKSTGLTLVDYCPQLQDKEDEEEEEEEEEEEVEEEEEEEEEVPAPASAVVRVNKNTPTPPVSVPPRQGAQANKGTANKGPPQMVTIRRVMEPSSSEPTVTITLKGDTPEKDTVLFTLVNGQGKNLK
jgi:hypothetical protein